MKPGEVDCLLTIGKRDYDIGKPFAPVDIIGVIKLLGVYGLRGGFVEPT